jgi:hypothetical protein
VAAAHDFKWAAIDAVRLAISLLSSVYLLRSAGFLLLYFFALWAAVRWHTYRRASRIIARWKTADASVIAINSLSLPYQVIDWMDDLLDPIRRHHERIEHLAQRAKQLASDDPAVTTPPRAVTSHA